MHEFKKDPDRQCTRTAERYKQDPHNHNPSGTEWSLLVWINPTLAIRVTAVMAHILGMTSMEMWIVVLVRSMTYVGFSDH